MDLPGIRGRVAVVTGSAQGIGKSIAEAFARQGASVVISDIQEDLGMAAASELGQSAMFVPCDISDYSQVNQLMDAVIAKFGRIDIMVNNAGYHPSSPDVRRPVQEYPIDTWRKILDVSLTGTFSCCKLAAAQMVRQGSGSIINIASVAGVVALRLQIGHVAVKSAIIKMTEAMACELGGHGIRVNTVSPGSTLTEATKELFYGSDGTLKEFATKLLSFIPQGRPGESVEVADAVLFLASDAAAYVNGQNLIVDGGWTCGFSRDF